MHCIARDERHMRKNAFECFIKTGQVLCQFMTDVIFRGCHLKGE